MCVNPEQASLCFAIYPIWQSMNQSRPKKIPPIVYEIRLWGLILKTVGMIEPVLQALLPIKEPITLALVYGSVAKGPDISSSDIDLLIVANDLALETV